jgi:MFS family permease
MVSPAWALNLYAICASFSVYFCMYAFRKPFSAGTFDGMLGIGTGIRLKTAMVISQVLGYALSKYLGARILPELPPERRPLTILGLVSASWSALFAFALGGVWAQLFALFLNGLCLGMIWGLVVGFLEGRRASEFLLAGLSCSFILASGSVKDVGRYLMRDFGVSELWMPALTGSLFFPLLVVSVFGLAQIPPPRDADERERHPRTRMLRTERRKFVRETWLPLSLALASYLFVTAYRDYRDNYGVEIFTELGYSEQPALFTTTEMPVALAVLFILALLSLVRDHQKALLLLFSVMVLGLLSLGGAALLLKSREISGATFMFLVGLGSYLTFVPFGSMLFERIVAHRRVVGTAVFGIYLADALGYTGSIAIQIYSDFLAQEMSRLRFFLDFTYLLSVFGAALLLVSGVLWIRAGAPKKA